MEWKDLAPWITIAITLALSILVPVFTQIANNRFQLKQAKQEREFAEEKERLAKRTEAYESFLSYVGAATMYKTKENLPQAGASIGRVYLYVSSNWYAKLDALHHSLYDYEWGVAEKQFSELAKMIADEYKRIESSPTNNQKGNSIAEKSKWQFSRIFSGSAEKH